jgi:N-acetyl-1-D-myo-inositol-2-amino-2-deoxy-alpha-D-glucopyranoside deacetylase
VPGPGRLVGGLVAVHAHPDDETLATGALLATFAAAGRPVTVVTCTRGERGEVIGAATDPGLARLEGDGAALAEHRLGELAGALAALGVGDHVVLDRVAGDGPWVDSGMVWAPGEGVTRAEIGADVPEGAFALVDVEVAAERLARVLRDRRPEVVAGYEPGGGYGHPDHVQAHRVMTRAVALAADEGPGHDRAALPGWAVPCVLWAALDADALVAARLSAPVRAGLAAPEEGLPSAAVPGVAVDVRVDVVPVLARVLAALRAHATQVRAVEAVPAPGGGPLAWYALSNDVLQPVLARESYRTAPGSRRDAVRWPDGVRVR